MQQENKFSDILKSPMSLAMLVIGAALVLGVPYWALQTLPGISNPVTGEAPAPKGDPNAGINFDELSTLPEELAQSAAVILSQEEGVLPEPLLDLPEASGFGLIYPVTEATDTVQPTLSWTLFAPGPFKIVVKDKAGEVVTTAQNIPNTAMVLPKKLNPGATYSWQVTASNNETQDASFVVMSTENVAELQRARKDFPQSHLALGLLAEHFGLLSTAEREYQALGREFPNAEAPARLLANVTALRD
jgi:hypothetical protein